MELQIFLHWDTLSCDPRSDQYLPQLMAVYDEMPERMRPSLCTLERVFVSDDITSVAFAAPVQNSEDEMPIAGIVGQRKGTLVNQPDTHELFSWKEQLPFGGSTEFLHNDPSLLQVFY